MRPLGDIALVGSIRELGLLTPITVTRERRALQVQTTGPAKRSQRLVTEKPDGIAPVSNFDHVYGSASHNVEPESHATG